MEFDLRAISLGAGVQSSALYILALEGVVGPLPDLAIFADTQREPPWVYENLWRLAEYGGDKIPIVIASLGDIGEAVRRKVGASRGRFASVPFWVESEEKPGKAAPGRRQCTREYKIDVVKQELRRQLGVGFRQRATRFRVEQWIGISTDEASRAKPSRTPWITTRHPLLYDKPMSRRQLVAYLAGRGWPEIKKSSCVFCPYRQDAEWLRWKKDEPALFAEAVGWDELIRDSSRAGLRRPQFLSRSLVPLSQLTKKPPSPQADLFQDECEGMCGV